MISAWTFYSLLIGVAGYTDWRWRMVPNQLSWLAIGFIYAMVGAHLWSWAHVSWAVGIWILFEVSDLVFPQAFAYGDIKVAAWTMAFWPTLGVWLVVGGTVWATIYGALTWWPQRRQQRFRTASAPWAVGVALMWVLVLVSR